MFALFGVHFSTRRAEKKKQKKNCSVQDFSALRAATFIKKYIEMQQNVSKRGAKHFSALRTAMFIKKTVKTAVYKKSALRAIESIGL